MTMVKTTTAGLGYVQDAWDAMTYFHFRPELFHEQFVTERPTKQVMPGAVVKLTKTNELAEATSELTEDEDVTPVTFGDSKHDVILREYGNVVKTTAKIRGTSYIPLDPVVANLLGYNAGVSIDSIVRDVLNGGSNVSYAGSAANRAALTNEDHLDSGTIRRQVASLRKASVPTIKAGLYASIIHPDVSVDLREETGATAWRDPHVYSAPGEIWRGEIGSYEGTFFVEAPRAKTWAEAGAEDAEVYSTLFVGAHSTVKAFPIVSGFGPNPRTVPGPITDHLRRFVPMGWYHLVGYARFREESLRRFESGSSLDV